jgi:acetyl-CoA acetyltransferase
METLGKLKPVFRKGGTVTAGNASPMNDGAAAMLVMSERGLESSKATPMARIVSRATSGVEPHLYGIGPVEAARTASGDRLGDIAAVELKRPSLRNRWRAADGQRLPAIVSQQGSTIAIGHRSVAQVAESSPRSPSPAPQVVDTAWQPCASVSAKA